MDKEIQQLLTFDQVLNNYYDYQDIGGEHSVQEFISKYFKPMYNGEFDFLGYKRVSPNINMQD